MNKTFAINKKAGFEYELLEKHEAGMVLKGFEVKSVRTGRINLEGSYILIRNAGAFLLNASIAPYQSNNTPSGYDPQRTRALLLKKREIDYLAGKSQEKGLTLVPLRCYDRGHRIKLEFAVARKKKKYDKRETIKKRETKREISRTLKK